MEVGCDGSSRVTYGADRLSFSDTFAFPDLDFLKVRVACLQPVAVFDFYVCTVSCLEFAAFGYRYLARGGGHDHSSSWRGEVDARMVVTAFVKRVDADTKSRDNEVEIGVYDRLKCRDGMQVLAANFGFTEAVAERMVYTHRTRLKPGHGLLQFGKLFFEFSRISGKDRIVVA